MSDEIIETKPVEPEPASIAPEAAPAFVAEDAALPPTTFPEEFLEQPALSTVEPEEMIVEGIPSETAQNRRPIPKQRVRRPGKVQVLLDSADESDPSDPAVRYTVLAAALWHWGRGEVVTDAEFAARNVLPEDLERLQCNGAIRLLPEEVN